MVGLTNSKVFSVEEQVAFAKHCVPGVAQFVLLTNVAHVEVFLVVEVEVRSLFVEPDSGGNRHKWPEDSLLDHRLSNHDGCQTCSQTISHWHDVAVVNVLLASNVSPVSLNGCPVLVGLSLEDVVLEEKHSKVDSSLVVLWDTSVVLVQVVEVILVAGIQLGSQQNCHS